ncbi:hypothetical protein [Hydrocarboniphaga sp.]|uniref:hypothetical protein n=1 Tax=Hydrocarboniphaga sp. TaxID=2033016 RepID=UPI003D0F7BB0
MKDVGIELAQEVAAILEGGLIITFWHKEYCGVGLRFHEGIYIYDESMDSTIGTDQELVSWGWKPSVQRRTFSTRQLFVSWLARQSNESLSGAELENWLKNNQRLTVERLKKAVKFARNNPTTRWNEYAG